MRTYAIGDIHGQLELLREAHARIDRDRAQTGDADSPVVHVGDLVDRGPDVRGVIDHLLARREAGAPDVTLLGNHDRMMRRFLHPDRLRDELRSDLHWLQSVVGGRETLASYGVDVSKHRPIPDIHQEARQKVPQAHLDYLESLTAPYVRGGCIFVHAGILPGIPLEAQSMDDLVWIRREFLLDRRDHGGLVVHGHTPIDVATHYGNRLNLDSGAAYGGPLSTVVIEGADVWLLGPRGREPIHRSNKP